MTFKPANNRLLVRLLEPKRFSPSGLISLPDSMKDEQQEAEIVAVDPKAGLSASPIGTRILLGKYAGSPITLDGEKLLLISSDEILGYWQEDAISVA